jgi:peptide/nickel transport system ATP-binding protein
MNENKLLEIKNLTIQYKTDNGLVHAVNDLSLSLKKGESLGLVGETGAGKTTTALGIMNLVPDPPGIIIGGEIQFEGSDLLKLSKQNMRKVRGEKISMVSQDPMTSLNPVMTVGKQIAESVRIHETLSRKEAEQRAVDVLEMVGIPGERFNEYPHQFSGGMRQRVVIAIALACRPDLLIADEPTTALDVTIQAQVLDLIANLKKEQQSSLIMITHDLGVVAEVCEKVAIMYAGRLIEYGTLDDIYNHTRHPYSIGLFSSIPSIDGDEERLRPIPGLMPDPINLPKGCSFWPRCNRATENCKRAVPALIESDPDHWVRCIHIDKAGFFEKNAVSKKTDTSRNESITHTKDTDVEIDSSKLEESLASG